MANGTKMITVTRKLTLYPQGDKAEVDRVYKYLRNGMEVQSLMLNQCMSAMYVAHMTIKDSKELKDKLKEISLLYSHVPNSKKGSAYDFDMSKYPTGLPLAGSIPRACREKLSKSFKDGLKYGKVSLPTFKSTTPLYVHNDFVNIRGSKLRSDGKTKIDTGIYHDYDSPMALSEALRNETNPGIHIKFANSIVFDVVLGNPYKSAELRSVLENIFAGEYRICDSSIGIDKRTGKKIELNLSLQIPVAVVKLDDSVVVGVDIGLAVPAMCALNNDYYTRLSIGSYEDFTRQRTKIQAIRKRVTKQLKNTTGGHGRQKKLAHLDKIQLHEREFARTYSHMVSKWVIDFALKNRAGYINLENLSSFKDKEKNEFVLRNWSYHELQTMIEYKAVKAGIKVRYVDSAYTSQTCSVCGERGIRERERQSEFICINPKCKCHKMYEDSFNADFNGARNIAMSTKFVDKKEKISKAETKSEKIA